MSDLVDSTQLVEQPGPEGKSHSRLTTIFLKTQTLEQDSPACTEEFMEGGCPKTVSCMVNFFLEVSTLDLEKDVRPEFPEL